jgi:reactive intermediate/imine deaminase
MLQRKMINTSQAPEAIGTYSQAVRVGDTVYISGQIPLNPETQLLVEGSFKKQLYQAFDNLQAICEAAGGKLNDIVKLNIYLLDLKEFPIVNAVMAEYFNEPYPARAVLGVASLPKNASVEMDAIMVLSNHG